MVTRIPLQTGGSAWIARVFAVAFALGSGLSALLVSVLALGEDVPLAHRLLLPLVPLVFCGVSIASHAVLWRSRASDLLLDDEGLLVDGPVVDGSRRYAWTDLALTRCRLDVDPSARVKVNDHVTYQHFLRVGLAAGGEATLARSVDDDEIASFREVVALLRSRADVPEPRPLPPEVLRCDGCGAPVAPAEGPLTRCGRCGRDVSVPEALIERVRSARRRAEGHDVARRELAVVGRMPSAAVANRWLLATLVAPYVALIGACAAPFPASTWVPALSELNEANACI